jgi:hypothetical protein
MSSTTEQEEEDMDVRNVWGWWLVGPICFAHCFAWLTDLAHTVFV